MTNTMQITSPLFPNQVIVVPQEQIQPQEQPEQKMKKDGTPKRIVCNKKKGRKSEVYPFEIEDMKKMIAYFAENEMWAHYLIFVMSCNMARRIGDTLSLTWEHIFFPETGKMRTDLLEIMEDKTDKLANPRINTACRKAIELYIEKTGCDPSENGYKGFVFMQLTGTHKGNVMTADGYRKALKKAAVAVGIEYNVGTHSPRKTFGKMSRMLHPGDYDSMELLQTIYNHSDSKTTKYYIGLTKQKVDKYYDDMGTFFDEYVTGDKTFEDVSDQPIVSMDTNDLRDIIAAAYKAGSENAGNPDSMVHIEAINTIMSMVDELAK